MQHSFFSSHTPRLFEQEALSNSNRLSEYDGDVRIGIGVANGEFKEGKLWNGKKIDVIDGEPKGEFNEGKLNGFGEEILNGIVVAKGEFLTDVLWKGQRAALVNGEPKGEFNEGKLNGFGEEILNGIVVALGEFKLGNLWDGEEVVISHEQPMGCINNGKLNGEGKQISNGNIFFQGLYEDGQRKRIDKVFEIKYNPNNAYHFSPEPGEGVGYLWSFSYLMMGSGTELASDYVVVDPEDPDCMVCVFGILDYFCWTINPRIYVNLGLRISSKNRERLVSQKKGEKQEDIEFQCASYQYDIQTKKYIKNVDTERPVNLKVLKWSLCEEPIRDLSGSLHYRMRITLIPSEDDGDIVISTSYGTKLMCPFPGLFWKQDVPSGTQFQFKGDNIDLETFHEHPFILY